MIRPVINVDYMIEIPIIYLRCDYKGYYNQA